MSATPRLAVALSPAQHNAHALTTSASSPLPERQAALNGEPIIRQPHAQSVCHLLRNSIAARDDSHPERRKPNVCIGLCQFTGALSSCL